MGFRYLIDLVNGDLVNGEGSASLLLLNYYANSSSTISVISFQLSIYHSLMPLLVLLTNNRS
jgi:hypothetical protein